MKKYVRCSKRYNNLTEAQYDFLEGFAQAYGGIDYNDIMDFDSRPVEPSDLRRVSKLITTLRRDLREVGMDAYDASMEYEDIKQSCEELVAAVRNNA